jgi:hypothetical protein
VLVGVLLGASCVLAQQYVRCVACCRGAVVGSAAGVAESSSTPCRQPAVRQFNSQLSTVSTATTASSRSMRKAAGPRGPTAALRPVSTLH